MSSNLGDTQQKSQTTSRSAAAQLGPADPWVFFNEECNFGGTDCWLGTCLQLLECWVRCGHRKSLGCREWSSSDYNLDVCGRAQHRWCPPAGCTVGVYYTGKMVTVLPVIIQKPHNLVTPCRSLTSLKSFHWSSQWVPVSKWMCGQAFKRMSRFSSALCLTWTIEIPFLKARCCAGFSSQHQYSRLESLPDVGLGSPAPPGGNPAIEISFLAFNHHMQLWHWPILCFCLSY